MKVAALDLRVLGLTEIDEAVNVARLPSLTPLRTHVIKVHETLLLVPHYTARVLEPGSDFNVKFRVSHAARV